MFAAFLAPYLMRIVLWASVMTAIGGGFLYFKIHYEHVGRDNERAKIDDTNKDASNAARAGIKNADDCDNANGNWDQSVGLCK